MHLITELLKARFRYIIKRIEKPKNKALTPKAKSVWAFSFGAI